MRRSRNEGNSLTIAFIFLCCIMLLLAGGFFLKLFLVLRESHFDGTHQYIVEVDESAQKGALISFVPSNKSIVVLVVGGQTGGNIGKYLQIPTDAKVHMDLPENMSQFVSSMLTKAKDETDITFIDKLRLLLFVNSLKPTDFHEQTITLPVDASVTEKLLPGLFQDNALYAENASVAVVNATGESGVGSEVAHMLAMIGMNVISVTSSNDNSDTTSLVVQQNGSYTQRRLQQLFHVGASVTKTPMISDITLTIGKNSLPQL